MYLAKAIGSLRQGLTGTEFTSTVKQTMRERENQNVRTVSYAGKGG